MKFKLLFCLLIFLFANAVSEAQWEIETFGNVGSNQVSEGSYFTWSALMNRKLDNFVIGFGANSKPLKNSFALADFKLELASEFFVNEQAWEAKIFLYENFFSERLSESNWGALLLYNTNKFEFALGNSFRTYRYRNLPQSDGLNSRLHENWNLLYRISWKAIDHPDHWGLSAGVSNYDHFLIHQESNPLFNLKGSYRIRSNVACFLEAWYLSAGAFNINVNYFGYFIRTGIKWQL